MDDLQRVSLQILEFISYFFFPPAIESVDKNNDTSLHFIITCLFNNFHCVSLTPVGLLASIYVSP